jgi:Na+/phosphate symporter
MKLEAEDCLCPRKDADGKNCHLEFNAASAVTALPFYIVERLAAWALRVAVTRDDYRATNWRHLIRDTIPEPMLAVLDRARYDYPENVSR